LDAIINVWFNEQLCTTIRNTNTIEFVMKNGRLYNGNTLDEVTTGKHKLDRGEWIDKKPIKNTKVED